MNLGPLDKRCRIERKLVTQDPDYGTEAITWTLLAVRWCSLVDDKPIQSESVKQGIGINVNRARVQMRYCTDIDSSMRLVIMRPAETVYQIVGGPSEIGNHEGVEFAVEKVSS